MEKMGYTLNINNCRTRTANERAASRVRLIRQSAMCILQLLVGNSLFVSGPLSSTAAELLQDRGTALSGMTDDAADSRALFGLSASANRSNKSADFVLKVGAAAVELYADDEMFIAGGIGPGKATGQDGMLRAVATVVEGPPNETRIAIVALDILKIRRDYLDVAARKIEVKTGIPFDHILINCTHNHHAPSAVKGHAYDVIPEFAEQVQDAIVQSVVKANGNLKDSPPVTMLFKMGSEETVGDNSRIELSDGTIAWRFDHDDELRPTGPFDPDFPVMVFKRPDRSLAAVLFGHSTHTVGTRNPGRRSPAFYGLAAQAFEQEVGAVTTFLEGASGSTHLRHLDGLTFSRASREVSVEAERRILNALRYTVDQAKPMLVSRIASARREVTVTVRNFDEQKEERAVSYYSQKRLGAEAGEKTAAVFRQARAELAPYRGEERKTWISATRVGDVVIVGVPAELFTQLGMDIKKRSPFRHTIIAELANDYVGYVGNADAYRLGGYQMWMGHHSWTQRGTGELFVDEAVKLLNELYKN